MIFIIVTMTNLLQYSCIMLNKILSSELKKNCNSPNLSKLQKKLLLSKALFFINNRVYNAPNVTSFLTFH